MISGPIEQPHPDVDETDLVRRLQRGEERAFDQLVQQHARPLYRLAYALVGNADDAEDVVQQAYLGALRAIGSFKGRSSLRTWLSRIVMNQAWKLRRSAHARRSVPMSSHLPAGPPAAQRDPALPRGGAPAEPRGVGTGDGALRSPATEVEQRMDVIAMLDALSHDHRAVIVLRELEGLSYQEVADVLGVPRGTVESRLFRAREELRRRFGRYLA